MNHQQDKQIAPRTDGPRRARLIFLVGYRRSGTTALQDQLTAHPEVHYYSGVVRNEFHLFDLYERDRDEYAMLVESHTGRAPSFDVVADAEAVFAGCPRPVGLVKSTRMLLDARTWDRFRQWAEQTSHEVIVLSIVRFPLDSISSDITRDSPELPPERRFQPIIPDVRVATPQSAQDVWCEAYRRALDETGFASRSRLIRLEEIVADPASACASLRTWLELDAPLIPAVWHPLHWGRWRDDPAFARFRPSDELVALANRIGYRIEPRSASRPRWAFATR